MAMDYSVQKKLFTVDFYLNCSRFVMLSMRRQIEKHNNLYYAVAFVLNGKRTHNLSFDSLACRWMLYTGNTAILCDIIKA